MVSDEHAEIATIARMEIQRSLGRVEGKLDQIIAGMALHENLDRERFAAIDSDLETLGKRTAGLEKKIWYGMGVGAVALYALSHLKDFIGYFKI